MHNIIKKLCHLEYHSIEKYNKIFNFIIQETKNATNLQICIDLVNYYVIIQIAN